MCRTAEIALIGSLVASATGCLPTVYFDGGDATRAEVGPETTVDSAMDADAADATVDSVTSDLVPIEDVQPLDTVEADVEVPCDSSACNATATLIAPLSGSVTAGAPFVRFRLSAGASDAHLAFCRDRLLLNGCRYFTSASALFRPTLAAGTWFWQARANTDGVLGTMPSPTWEFVIPEETTGDTGATIASIPDVNGDGLGDAIIGSYTAGTLDVALGTLGAFPTMAAGVSAPTVIETGSRSWLTHCDVNGDGFVDVVIGIPSAGTTGSVSFMLGGPSGLGAATTAMASPSSGAHFGYAVACAGDVNGDGRGDIAVGSPDANSGDGQVDILFGPLNGMPPMTPVRAPLSGQRGRFGASIAGNGDVNGDGELDLVVGEPSYASLAGRAHVLQGTGGGGFSVSSSYPATAGTASRFVGTQLAFVGDVDRDGRIDYAIASAPTSGMWTVHVVRSANIPVDLTGTQNFGASLTGADVNRDGYWDVVVGSPSEASPFGGIYVYVGASVMGSTTPISTAGTIAAGSSLSYAGDMNGDGASEFLVGAPGSNGGIGTVQIFSAPTALSMSSGSIAPSAGRSQFGVILAR